MAGTTEGSFTRAFLRGVAFRIGLLSLAMALAVGGVALGSLSDAAWAPFLGGCAGLAAGLLLGRVVLQRWDPLTGTGGGVPGLALGERP